jgi:3',5'-cyclic AMP phosphodiesterase CpdA
VTAGGDISRVKNLLDVATTYSNFIGIVNAHEALWTNCPMTFDEMAGLKTQLKAYLASKGRSDVKVWNYIDNLYTESKLPDAQIDRIMDVAVTWQHCAGGAEGSCASALTATKNDITRAAGHDIELVWLIQTFTTSSPYTAKFTLQQLEDTSCQFIQTGIGGFGYYTWDANWWPDLKEWADLQPAVPWVAQNCAGGVIPPTPVPTQQIPTKTYTPTPQIPTNTPVGPTPAPTETNTPKPPTVAPTATNTSIPPTATTIPPTPIPGQGFTFASIGDGQGITATFTKTVNQIAGLRPNFVLFNGDLENDGVVSSEMNTMVGDLKTAGIFNQTFLVRGNHDDHISGSAALWNSYFTTNTPGRPQGMANYIYMGTTQPYLTYSFDFGNARFIGLDVPGGATLITSAQYTFIDQRLTDAENSGLVHAFINFHGGEYCTTSVHCSCSAKNASSCTPSAFVTMLNKHPIVSATFHGHEHILAWIHMDSSRVSSLTHPYESFFTSPSGGGSYNGYIYPARVDYYYTPMASYNEDGFAMVNVNGRAFTVSIYKTGVTAPAWTKTFTK